MSNHKELDHRQRKSQDIVTPLVLIFLGLVFLFQNLNMLPSNIWVQMAKFWPLLLVLYGLQMLAHKSVSKALVFFVTVSVGIWVLGHSLAREHFMPFWVSAFKTTPWFSVNESTPKRKLQTDSVDESDYQRADIDKRVVNINANMAEVVISDTTANYYLKTDSRLKRKANKIITHQVRDRVLNMDIQADTFGQAGKYDLKIGQSQVATDISARINAGKIILDTKELVLDNLDIQVNVGSAVVKLDSQKNHSKNIQAHVDLGNISIQLPENVGLKVKYNVDLGKIVILGNEFSGSGEYNTDPNFTQSITIDARVGLGSIEIFK